MSSSSQDNGAVTYGKQLVKVAPLFALKSAVGDFPKAVMEKTIESRLADKTPWRKAIGVAAGGRASGRLIGGLAGIATAPLFLKGIDMTRSEDRKTKLKGLGLVGASTVGFQAAKGGMEGAFEARKAGLASKAALGKAARLGSIRMGFKLPMALATAAGIAASRKAKDGEASPAKKYIGGALTGAAAGAISRPGEQLIDHAFVNGRKGLLAKVKKLGPATLGGAAGGLFGGLVLAGLIDKASKYIKKDK